MAVTVQIANSSRPAGEQCLGRIDDWERFAHIDTGIYLTKCEILGCPGGLSLAVVADGVYFHIFRLAVHKRKDP